MSAERQAVQGASLGFEDLGLSWRIDVARCWRGLALEPGWQAQVLVQDQRRRWKPRGLPVMAGDARTAVADLLSMLDLEQLPAGSSS